MIEFNHVCAAYEVETPILNDVSFEIGDGDFVAFVGTNGAGKSTTMRLCNGLLKPTSGQVLVDGVATTELKTSQLARKIGFLFQNPDRQICCKTVREELMFGFKIRGDEGPEAEARVKEIIEQFGFDPDAEPYLLNRGTRQLLALASIVVLDTPTVILDEPTTGLDYRECEKVMGIVSAMHARGTTVIMVCHDMEVVADFAERVIVMTRGRMVAEGPTFDMLRDREILRQADLVAPQIADISMRLCEQDARFLGTPLGNANSVGEMVAAVEGAVAKGGASK